MGLYKKITPTHGGIKRNETTEGLPPERAWQALKDDMSTGNIQGKTPMYPAEGIPYGTDIRSNKWDKAVGENDKLSKAIAASRDKKAKAADERRQKMLDEKAKERAEKAAGNTEKGGDTATPTKD